MAARKATTKKVAEKKKVDWRRVGDWALLIGGAAGVLALGVLAVKNRKGIALQFARADADMYEQQSFLFRQEADFLKHKAETKRAYEQRLLKDMEEL